ncbi:MAG: homoserine O-succinyltransferase [Terracidiphilus sp.]
MAIGLVNNMPDGALQQTERQFASLLSAASEGMDVCLGLYSMPDVPRSESGASLVEEKYLSVEQLWDMRLDALIVTGREPLSPKLQDEPYWEVFTRLFDWAQERTYATVWSCLAAHAAVLHRDGIGRVRRDSKASGIFDCEQVAGHHLLKGVPSRFRLPHSRWNTVTEDALRASGYSILSRTSSGDVDIFARQDKSLFLYFQGHPEYEANTLLLEYRRDIARYCRSESATYPSMPANYFEPALASQLADLQCVANGHGRSEHLAQANALLESANAENRWFPSAVQIYRNWLQYIQSQKAKEVVPASAPLHSIAAHA